MSREWYHDLVDADSKVHAQVVAKKIRGEIRENGFVSFSRFMDLALYAPGLGYYCVGTEKIGVHADFVTAPEISPLFAQCVANYCHRALADCTEKTVLEIGAGTGRLAVGILRSLAEQNALPERYLILDISAELQSRQRALIQNEAPEFLSRVQWLTALPEKPFEGVILANEVLDAMPVSLFQATEKGIQERVVSLDDQDSFVWSVQPASSALKKAVEALGIDFAPGYYSEINLAVEPWIRSLDALLRHGDIVLIDYGFLRAEYYHPQRSSGTLMCHYQQRAHADPLILTGIQDITAHVDFTTVGEAAEALSMKVSDYCTQAEFLLKNGLLDIMQRQATSPEQQFNLANQVKMLTLPSEMGELFKVMVLKRTRPGR